MARATAKSNGATPEATDATAMVLGSMGSGVAMAEVGSGPGADGPAPRARRAGPVVDGLACTGLGPVAGGLDGSGADGSKGVSAGLES
jgi:hypothetical protein